MRAAEPMNRPTTIEEPFNSADPLKRFRPVVTFNTEFWLAPRMSHQQSASMWK